MKLWLRGNPFYGFDLQPDADNAAVGKYANSIAAGVLPAAFVFPKFGSHQADCD